MHLPPILLLPLLPLALAIPSPSPVTNPLPIPAAIAIAPLAPEAAALQPRAASPSNPAAPAPAAPAPAPTAAAYPYYYLKTCVKNPDKEEKGGLYVSAYHTGAGLNDVTLGPKTGASKGYLNGTYQEFDLGTAYPWGLSVGGDSNYAGWEFVSINAGLGTGGADGGFYFDDKGLQWNNTQFGGWLACSWWHALPQLFWKSATYNYALPVSCAEVTLVREDVPATASS